MGNTWRVALAGLALAGLVAAGCGGDDAEVSAPTIDPTPPPYVLPEPTESEIQNATFKFSPNLVRFRLFDPKLVNDRRASGTTCDGVAMPPVPPLKLNSLLGAAALNHANDMAANNYFDHTGLDGSTPESRIAATGYKAVATGENLAAGTATNTWPLAIAQLFESPGHCKNFMSAEFTEIGSGYASNANAKYVNYYAFTLGRPQP